MKNPLISVSINNPHAVVAANELRYHRVKKSNLIPGFKEIISKSPKDFLHFS